MPNRPASFLQADIARALRAFRDQGITARVVIRADGSTAIEPFQKADEASVKSAETAREITP